MYYQDLHNSLTRTPMPFKEFFLKRLENRKSWEMGQKIFSLIGFVVVVTADVFVVIAFLVNK
jgi:hypothetical protein